LQKTFQLKVTLSFFLENTAKLLCEDLLDILKMADFRVLNLEIPLTTDYQAPIIKCGPNSIAPTSTINGIKQIQTDLLMLANNHILDQGEHGLYSTIKALEEMILIMWAQVLT
jgi:poly-gamma-glutamate capsule biosynthesis protein CapA/YwtB (metallophosphatase superfamily)